MNIYDKMIIHPMYIYYIQYIRILFIYILYCKMYHGICLMPKDHDKFSHQKYQKRERERASERERERERERTIGTFDLCHFVTVRKIPPVSRTCLKCIFSKTGGKTWGETVNFSKAQSSSLCASLGF